MRTPPKDISPEEVRSDIAQMKETTGWVIFCTAYDLKIAEIERKIMDPKTPDEEANVLRKAREQVMLLRPDLLATDIVQCANAELKRLSK